MIIKHLKYIEDGLSKQSLFAVYNKLEGGRMNSSLLFICFEDKN